ncbi:MAG: DUF3134 family protein [Synechococcales cyanobacterium RM1_1_8]|nr:DUF3134 family protein [Synechococcales cyanobacterium RM1_1_8]
MENPSLRSEPRYQQAPVLPSAGEPSILEWLEKSGRLIARESDDSKLLDAEEEEIAALMGVDDGKFDEEDDDGFDDDD